MVPNRSTHHICFVVFPENLCALTFWFFDELYLFTSFTNKSTKIITFFLGCLFLGHLFLLGSFDGFFSTFIFLILCGGSISLMLSRTLSNNFSCCFSWCCTFCVTFPGDGFTVFILSVLEVILSKSFSIIFCVLCSSYSKSNLLFSSKTTFPSKGLLWQVSSL